MLKQLKIPMDINQNSDVNQNPEKLRIMTSVSYLEKIIKKR